jgi:hypothetical protein
LNQSSAPPASFTWTYYFGQREPVARSWPQAEQRNPSGQRAWNR